tara:strand:+ start:148 stop:279 length:132 start_codon:yes stop_codon:yes gene_type:complete
MPYSQTVVVAGGLAHIPIIIALLKFVENKYNGNKPQLDLADNQ